MKMLFVTVGMSTTEMPVLGTGEYPSKRPLCICDLSMKLSVLKAKDFFIATYRSIFCITSIEASHNKWFGCFLTRSLLSLHHSLLETHCKSSKDNITTHLILILFEIKMELRTSKNMSLCSSFSFWQEWLSNAAQETSVIVVITIK